MKSWYTLAWVQIALWLGAYAALGYTFGKFAWLLASPLVAYGIARPLMALASDLRHKILGAVWLPEHGKHFVFRNVTIHVVEDDEGQRWVDLADVFKVVGNAVTPRTLAIAYPGRVADRGSPARPHMRDDALVTHLGTKNQPEALRFRTWVERSIAVPGRKVRQNLDIDRDSPNES
jgi:hypothetical protein